MGNKVKFKLRSTTGETDIPHEAGSVIFNTADHVIKYDNGTQFIRMDTDTNTDTKVTQSIYATATTARPVILSPFSLGNEDSSSASNPTETADKVYQSTGLSFIPKTGVLIIGPGDQNNFVGANLGNSSWAPSLVIANVTSSAMTYGRIAVAGGGGLRFYSGDGNSMILYGKALSAMSNDIQLGVEGDTGSGVNGNYRWKSLYVSDEIKSRLGNVIVGTSNRSANIDVQVINNTHDCVFRAGTSNTGIYSNTKSKWLVQMTSGGTVATNVSSDRRLKNDYGIMPLNESITILKEVPLINYMYKDDEEHDKLIQNGIYAQDFRDVILKHNIPSYGILTMQKINDENGDTYFDINLPEEEVRYSINYEKFIPHLWNGWKYHDNEIEELKQRVTRLEDENLMLKTQLLSMQ